MLSGTPLRGWTGADIDAECHDAYRAYIHEKTERYRAYFSAHPELRDESHPYKAKDLPAALPEEWGHLADLMPSGERHKHHLSGNSSQTLALGLLGAAALKDSSLAWLWDGFSSTVSPLPARNPAEPVDWQFELTLSPGTLNEKPRQTSIDFAAADSAVRLCIECKWTEAGLGRCSCTPATAPLTSACSDRVLERYAYWTTAQEVFQLPERTPGAPCPLSFTYQAVRSAAAARALATEGQRPVFGLIYDAENPYFAGEGEWPGWPAMLAATVHTDESPVQFVSVSWQELLLLLRLDEAAAAWASEKHGLHSPAAA